MLTMSNQPIPELKNLNSVRVIISSGQGIGHQRAALNAMSSLYKLMSNSSNQTFSGDFDIWYDEPNDGSNPSVGSRLEKLIPGFKEKAFYLADSGWESKSSIFGKIKVTRLPEHGQLPGTVSPVQLTISAAGGEVYHSAIPLERWHTEHYIQLQPTGWKLGLNYIISKNKAPQELPSSLRLSADRLSTIPGAAELKETYIETRIKKLCEDNKFSTQLVYGLYPAYDERFNRTSGFIEPFEECKRLIAAHKELQKLQRKPVILFFPQKIWDVTKTFQKNMQAIFNDINIMWVDLTDVNAPEFGTISSGVVMAYTGTLTPYIFEKLMLEDSTFPPVIEGCNAQEACEFSGRPYIHGGAKESLFTEYKFDDRRISICQTMHRQASAYLCTHESRSVSSLVTYMRATQRHTLSLDFAAYHAARQKKHLEIPDACEYALQQVGMIDKSNLDSSVFSKKIVSTKEIGRFVSASLGTVIAEHRTENNLNKLLKTSQMESQLQPSSPILNTTSS